MTNPTKRINGCLLDLDSKEIVTDAMVDISLIFPVNPARRVDIRATLTTKGFKTKLNDKCFILKLNETVSWRVRITLQPISILHFDPKFTHFDIWFEDSDWHSIIEWFESI